MMLTKKELLEVIERAPLVSIDLIVTNRKGHILKGKRNNRPARGSWFVPGGRIRKEENLNSAITRLGENELNTKLTRDDVRFIGVFEHKYEDNFDNVEGISTYYVVLAYECCKELDTNELPLEQHSAWKWFCESQSNEVHKYSAAYFQAVKVIDNAGYSALNARRDAFNNLLWQTPVMSLIAQAFLFTIILSDNTTPVSRVIAAILAIIISVASVQLLSKHRYEEVTHAKELDDIEMKTGRYPINRYHKPKRWFLQRSFRIWLGILLSFGIVAFIVALLIIFRPDLITSNKGVDSSAVPALVVPEQKDLCKPIDRTSVGAEKEGDLGTKDCNLPQMVERDVIH